MRKTIYAKMTALPVGLCALAFAVTSCGSSEYKKFADNEGKQVASILRENDCLACHSENAPLPFYGNLPLIGPVVQADMKEAVHYVDLTAMVEASPKIISFIRARVIATFMRRKSFKKPIFPSSLALTKLIKMTSRSCPWKPSTVCTVISLRKGLKKASCLINLRMYCTCAL